MKLSIWLELFELYDTLEKLYQTELSHNFMRISALKIKEFKERHPGTSEMLIAMEIHFKKRGELG